MPDYSEIIQNLLTTLAHANRSRGSISETFLYLDPEEGSYQIKVVPGHRSIVITISADNAYPFDPQPKTQYIDGQ